MLNKWFLIESMGVTINLELITEVEWNASFQGSRATRICFGTNIIYDPEVNGVTANQWWIWNEEDRKRLRVALIILGLPTVELIP